MTATKPSHHSSTSPNDTDNSNPATMDSLSSVLDSALALMGDGFDDDDDPTYAGWNLARSTVARPRETTPPEKCCIRVPHTWERRMDQRNTHLKFTPAQAAVIPFPVESVQPPAMAVERSSSSSSSSRTFTKLPSRLSSGSLASRSSASMHYSRSTPAA